MGKGLVICQPFSALVGSDVKMSRGMSCRRSCKGKGTVPHLFYFFLTYSGIRDIILQMVREEKKITKDVIHRKKDWINLLTYRNIIIAIPLFFLILYIVLVIYYGSFKVLRINSAVEIVDAFAVFFVALTIFAVSLLAVIRTSTFQHTKIGRFLKRYKVFNFVLELLIFVFIFQLGAILLIAVYQQNGVFDYSGGQLALALLAIAVLMNMENVRRLVVLIRA